MRREVWARAVQVRASAAGAIVGLAFFLRVQRLADKNIWWDEGWTLWLARHDLAWIAWRTASDEHPPLHYWLMHVWNSLVGDDVFVGRFLSVFFGVLTVALIYRLGREIGGARLGLLAAFLLTLARFQVWWAQDIKNYTLSAFFALVSVWCALRLVAGRRSPITAYALSTTLALYSHYLAALIFLANNLFVAIVLLQKWRAGERTITLFARWSAAQLAALALFAPWLWWYLQQGATWSAAPAFDFALFVELAATVFALGVTTYIENYTIVVAAFTLLAGMGTLWVIAGNGQPQGAERAPALRNGALLALVIVVVPPLLLYALALTPAALFAPKIQARYLLMLLPAYTLLLALGILFLARFSKHLALGAFLLIAAAQMFTLNDYYRERVLRDDYFTLTNVVNAFALPGDGIVLNTDQEWPTFLYYLRPPRAWVGVPNGVKVDAASARRVAVQAGQYRAVWLVTIPDALDKDPERLVEGELARRLPKQYEQTFGDKRLALYAPQLRNVKDVPRENFAPQAARADAFDDRLRLMGVDVAVRAAQPGDTVRVVTYWESSDLATVRTLLQGDDGTIVAEQSAPISIGARERAQADLVIPPDARGGELRVTVQARLTTRELARVRVEPRALASSGGAAANALDYRLGESIHLTGDDLPRRAFRAGEAVPLTLFWKTERALTTSYTVFAHLLGAQYNAAQNNFLWGQVDRLPVEGRLPTSAWAVGQLVADAYAVPIQPHAPRGLYKIEVGLYDAATGTRLRVFDAKGQDVGDAVIVGEVAVR